MRRMSIHRPDAKLRGIPRHLRSLEKWAEGADRWHPQPYEHLPYWHCKIPVLDRLVEPPTINPHIQRQVISLLLRAATKLATQGQTSEWPYCRPDLSNWEPWWNGNLKRQKGKSPRAANNGGHLDNPCSSNLMAIHTAKRAGL